MRSGGTAIRIFALVLAGGMFVSIAAPAAAQDSLVQRPLITGLSFDGNHGVDAYTLATSIVTTNSSWWVRTGLVSWIGLGQRRYFDEREFRRDVLRLKLLYSQMGYPDAVIDTVVERKPARQPTEVTLRFRITEGQPVRVTDLAITGTEGIVSTDYLEDRIPLRRGEPFNRLDIGPATDTIREALQQRGYPFPEVFRGLSVDNPTHAATVSFDVIPGMLATYGRIDVAGMVHVSDHSIRRMLPMRTGKQFRRKDLVRAQRDLYATGAFDYVDVSLGDSTAGDRDSVVDVRVAVREGRFHRVRASPGYGTEDCFRVLTGFSAARALGGLRSFDVTARLSKIGTGAPFSWGLQNSLICRGLSHETDPDRLKLNYNVRAALSDPALFGPRIGGAISLFAERRSELEAYVREGFGGEASVTYRSPWEMPVTVSYELSRASTKASPASTCFYLNICSAADIATYEEPRRSAILGLVVLRNRQNNVLDPTRGSFASVEVRWGSPLLGSDSLSIFGKLQGQIAGYEPLGERSVVAWRLGAGTLLFGRQINVAGADQEYVPPEERFYGGGANSVRGYAQNELGPVVRVIEFKPDSLGNLTIPDTIASASGGSDMVVANVEMRTAVPGFGGRVQFALFLDVGQVFDRKDNVLQDPGLRFTPGIGLRFSTGVGPIRFDLGYNGYAPREGPLYVEQGGALVPDPNNPTYAPPLPSSLLDRLRLHFSVGQAF